MRNDYVEDDPQIDLSVRLVARIDSRLIAGGHSFSHEILDSGVGRCFLICPTDSAQEGA